MFCLVRWCFCLLVFPRLEGLDMYSQVYERSYTVNSSILNAIEPHLKDFQQLLVDPPKVKLWFSHYLSSLGWWGWLIFMSFLLQYFISRCWYILSLVIVSYCSSWWSFLNSLRLIWPFPVSPLWHSCWSIGIKQHSVTTPVDVLCLYSLHRKVQYWRPLVFWSSHWGMPAFTSPGWWLLCCRPVRPVSARSSVISAPWTYYW